MSKSKHMNMHVQIKINANIGTFEKGPQPILMELYEKYKIRHPNAFFLRKSNAKWDGYVKYISGSGTFKIGLLPFVVEDLKAMGCTVSINDIRAQREVKFKIPKTLGKYTLRDNQIEACKLVLTNKVEGVPFMVGVLDNATNFGKTLVLAALHESFKRELKTLVLLNNKNIFEQAKREMKDYLPGEDIQFIQGKSKKFGNFNVAMVQTLAPNVKSLQKELGSIEILLVDEGDQADNKTYTTVITHCYNVIMRLALSGSIYLSKLKKDALHNMNLKCLFGKQLMVVSKRELMDKGISAEVRVKICQGNSKFTPSDRDRDNPDFNLSWLDFFKKHVAYNKDVHKNSVKRTLKNIKTHKRLPALIVVRFIFHCEELYKYYKKKLGKEYKIAYMHHETKNGEEILHKFQNGEIDILIITLIVRRGLNLPKARYMQNVSGTDSEESIVQLMGRMERKGKEKKISYVDDFYFFGRYLLRPSNHRVNYYLKQKVKVINLVKRNLKNLR